MKIYGNKTFNAVKVVLTAEEIGLDYEYVVVDLTTGEHKKQDYLKINPQGKIPALEHDGKYLSESNTMCRYLANISGHKLYSADAYNAAKIDQMVDFIALHAGRWISMYFFQELVVRDLLGKEIDTSAIDEAAGFLSQQLPYLDGVLGEEEFLCGDEVTIADTIAVAFFMTKDYTSLSCDDYKNICRWYDQMSARPAFAATMEHFPGGYGFK